MKGSKMGLIRRTFTWGTKTYFSLIFFLEELHINCQGSIKSTWSKKYVQFRRPPNDDYKNWSESKARRRHRPSPHSSRAKFVGVDSWEVAMLNPYRISAPEQQPRPMKRRVYPNDPICRHMNIDEWRSNTRGSIKYNLLSNPMRSVGHKPSQFPRPPTTVQAPLEWEIGGENLIPSPKSYRRLTSTGRTQTLTKT
jgi:hypothetical protein